MINPAAPGPSTRRRASAALRAAACLAPLALVAGCAAFPSMTTNPARPVTAQELADQPPFPNGASTALPGRAPTTLNIPGGAAPAGPRRQPATDEQIAALVSEDMVDATLAPQSIPQFVATVFGGVLGVPYSMAPDVATRTEVISGGTGGTISKRALFRLTQQALKQYGIEVYVDGGFVTVGNTEAQGIGATVTRDRSTPTSGGRVVQIFPVQTIEVNALQSLMADLFPNLGGARITPDPMTNSLLISGSGRDVAQVVRVLREIDQPRFAGTQVLRVQPVFWSADALAGSIEQAMQAEGFVVSRTAVAARPVIILAFPTANQILIFTKEPNLLERARYWAETLDQPAALGDKTSTFVYTVQNTDAQSLGKLAMGQAPSSVLPAPPVGVPGTPPAGVGGGQNPGQARQTPTTISSDPEGGSGEFLGGRLLVDPAGNRIIFTGTATDFAQLRDLLDTLDIPAPQVVVEVMIAEVTLTDATSLGVTLFGEEARGDGNLVGSTTGIPIANGTGGLLATFNGPDFRARLSAVASNNRVNILQRPQLVVRSGGTARFQVGTDIPIITSQRATDTSQTGNGTDVLQSIQYRQTGVILELKPVVYGDQVDVVISQENSSAGDALEGISSPTILNRSLTTQIRIGNGWTGVLGGLIGNNYTKNNSGVPFVKDLPVIGSAFQNNRVTGERTELLVLITPYIVRGNEDMADFADRYASDMNAAFRTGRGWSYTLTPWSAGGFRGVGVDLPVATRPSDRTPRQAAPPDAGAGDPDAASNPVVIVAPTETAPPSPPAPPASNTIVVTPPQG